MAGRKSRFQRIHLAGLGPAKRILGYDGSQYQQKFTLGLNEGILAGRLKKLHVDHEGGREKINIEDEALSLSGYSVSLSLDYHFLELSFYADPSKAFLILPINIPSNLFSHSIDTFLTML